MRAVGLALSGERERGRWDEVALAEHLRVADADLATVGITSAVAMAPSLHLNLGDGYLRLGRLDEAEQQVESGLAVQHTLPDDGYGAMIREGLDRLRSRVEEARG